MSATITSFSTSVAGARLATKVPSRRQAARSVVATPRAALEAARYATPYDGYSFAPITESQISRAVRFCTTNKQYSICYLRQVLTVPRRMHDDCGCRKRMHYCEYQFGQIVATLLQTKRRSDVLRAVYHHILIIKR
jgi:hypothetical protein